MKLNLSTAAFKHLSGYEASKILIKHGINNIELSSGKHEKDQIRKLKKLKETKFYIHNYFPPPEKPFVINLASLDSEIAKLSNDFIISALQNCSELNCPVYSFHPGFVVDIHHSEIGIKTTNKNAYNRKLCINNMLERLDKISIEGKKYGIDLLLENNVMKKSSFDYLNFDTTIMSHPDEIEFIMKNSQNNVNLLLDVAHLKVSSNILKFDLISSLKKIDSWIKAYHLSDNDGYNDNNKCVEKNSWFLQKLKKQSIFYTIEVYNSDIEILKSQIYLLKEFTI